ncbi:MAG: hypothetical protein QM519_08515, partial [Bacteroidia bacterium]|nr:hypothetical protein [Bacteroidia bacterium]
MSPFLSRGVLVLLAIHMGACVSIGNNVSKGSSATAPNRAAGALAPITAQQVNAAQQAWCDGLVQVAQVHARGGDARAEASRMIDDLYDYADGQVFFKPTLAFGPRTF